MPYTLIRGKAKMKTKEKRITVTVSDDLHKKLKIHAVESGTAMSTMILEWIKDRAKREIKRK